MTMLEQRIQQQFFESADLLYQAAEPLARPLADAAQAVLGCLTAGGKVLAAGGSMAYVFADLCVEGFERERPPLAALALPRHALAAGVRALGLPGDVLLLIDDGAAPTEDVGALFAAAHDKEMTVVALSGAEPAWRAALAETDVLITVPHERAARVRETQLLVLHTLADAVDLQLMGELDPA
jgi:D-sedoheptulose 7-phosphate isomerase